MVVVLEQLRVVIGNHEDLVIISYRNASIQKAISNVYPNAHHGIRIQHLYNNLSSRFRHISIESLFKRCAKAYSMAEYEFYMSAMVSVSSGFKDYPKKWALSHFVRKRYGHCHIL